MILLLAAGVPIDLFQVFGVLFKELDKIAGECRSLTFTKGHNREKTRAKTCFEEQENMPWLLEKNDSGQGQWFSCCTLPFCIRCRPSCEGFGNCSVPASALHLTALSDGQVLSSCPTALPCSLVSCLILMSICKQHSFNCFIFNFSGPLYLRCASSKQYIVLFLFNPILKIL